VAAAAAGLVLVVHRLHDQPLCGGLHALVQEGLRVCVCVCGVLCAVCLCVWCGVWWAAGRQPSPCPPPPPPRDNTRACPQPPAHIACMHTTPRSHAATQPPRAPRRRARSWSSHERAARPPRRRSRAAPHAASSAARAAGWRRCGTGSQRQTRTPACAHTRRVRARARACACVRAFACVFACACACACARVRVRSHVRACVRVPFVLQELERRCGPSHTHALSPERKLAQSARRLRSAKSRCAPAP
jgi:hypothetical protein